MLEDVSQLGLQVGQLLLGGLEPAVHIRKLPVSGRHLVRQLGQPLLNLSPLLLQFLDLGGECVAVAGQGRKGLLALASLLGHVLHLPVCRHKMLL